MYLRRLTVRGFKSFADKTDFEFESALTGVVGPNGCGKSNVVDALKWVLGDQRARSLRGNEMTDVIFKGAEGRDAAHQAEVIVSLSDVDRTAGNGHAEVTIGRRLTVSKESEYLLNGESVRLKDVRDFLMDTGLGVGAYSVMEQGRIDAVLSANPEDRRAIFEEAAGISRFKVQKRESLRRLDRTEQNLARIQDLLQERARRIRSLKVQAGRARRYQVLRDELRDLRTAVAVIEGRELRQQQAAVKQRLLDQQAQLEATDAGQRAAVARRRDAEAEIERRSVELEQLQEQIRARQSQQEGLALEAQTQEQRAEELSADADEDARRQQQLQDQHRERLEALAVARTRIVQLEEQLVQFAKDLEAKRVDVRRSQGEVRHLHEQREHARQQVLEWIHRRTRVRNLCHDHEAAVKTHGTRIRTLTERHQRLDTEAEQVEDELSYLQTLLAERHQGEADLDAEDKLLVKELHAADGEVADYVQRESALRQELSAAEGRLQVLNDMEAHMEGLDQGPRVVLERQPEGLCGRLLDLIDVDLEYSAALEAALGPYVQALVVATRAQADAILRMLREEGAGRALLLVASEFAGTPEASEAGPAAAVPPGAEALIEHVRAQPEARALLGWLLRGVFLVRTLDMATAKDTGVGAELCFVTRDGSLGCGPRLEGGSSEGVGGLVVRRAKIAVLKQEVQELRVQLQDLLAYKQAVTERVQQLRNECSDLQV
ncbi:MAG: chromosome segregation SMC family protein, partial [Planctomycetota bacterium]